MTTDNDFSWSADVSRGPKRVRSAFERVLGSPLPEAGIGFEDLFKGDRHQYLDYVRWALKKALDVEWMRGWATARNNAVEVITWHYRTRHFGASDRAGGEWIYGQTGFSEDLVRPIERDELIPFRGKSPYIEIYANEEARIGAGLLGPVSIWLPGPGMASKDSGALGALTVPSQVTEMLLRLPEPSGDGRTFTVAHVEEVRSADADFYNGLMTWLSRVRGVDVDALEALENLQASLKVTLRLLRDHRRRLPRSTFMTPVYVAGDHVGGFAFACDGICSAETACIGEDIADSLLRYLRLREDGLVYKLLMEKETFDAARRIFIQRLTHDLRHPLDSLAATARELAGSFGSIQDRIGQLDRILDETILAIEGRDVRLLLKARKRPDRVAEFLADVGYFFRAQFAEADKKLLVQPVDPSWTFSVDRSMLHEALQNLVVNALKHGGQTVEIAVEKRNSLYRLHVRDNGRGLAEGDKSELFRPRATGGKGLAIVRLLADAHGGRADYETGPEPFKADFFIDIPET